MGFRIVPNSLATPPTEPKNCPKFLPIPPDKNLVTPLAALVKKPNVLEHIAYRDTWGKGADSFLSMIYERIILMKDLMVLEMVEKK